MAWSFSYHLQRNFTPQPTDYAKAEARKGFAPLDRFVSRLSKGSLSRHARNTFMAPLGGSTRADAREQFLPHGYESCHALEKSNMAKCVGLQEVRPLVQAPCRDGYGD